MTTTAARATGTDYDVLAEDAPLGVQLWPTRSPEFAPNFTLAEVALVRNECRTTVRWTYESGTVRYFYPGERVACRTI